MSTFRSIGFLAALCLLIAPAANAQNVDQKPDVGPLFPISTDSNYAGVTLPNDVGGQPPFVGVVGYSASDANDVLTGPVNITATFGTNATWQDNLWVYNSSTVVLNGGDATHAGGTILGYLQLYETSSAIISGNGNATKIYASNKSTVTVNNGIVGLGNDPGNTNAGLYLHDSSSAVINGGLVTTLGIYSGTATVNGGAVTNLGTAPSAAGSITITLNGGSVSGSLIQAGATMNVQAGNHGGAEALNGGIINVNGGTLSGALDASNGTINLNNATVDISFESSGPDGSALMESGLVKGDASADQGSLMGLQGGNITGNVDAFATSNVSIGAVTIGGDVEEEAAVLNVGAGASIGGNLTANGGLISMAGGTVNQDLAAKSNATVTLTGGTIQANLQISDTALVVMSGGTVSGNASTLSSGNLLMTGGTVSGDMTSNQGSTLTLSGGRIQGNVISGDGSLVFFSGNAAISGSLAAHNASKISISGGEIDGPVIAYDNSTVDYTGGLIFGGIYVEGNGAKLIDAGGNPNAPQALVQGLSAPAHQISAADSTPSSPSIFLDNGGIIEVDGINISAALINSNTNGGQYSEFQLAGHYSDGTPISGGTVFYVQNQAGANLTAGFDFQATPQQLNIASGTGSWGDAANWSPNIVADGAGSVATLSSATAPATVTLDGDRTLGILNLDGSNSYTIDQGTTGSLIFDNKGAGAQINVTGQHEILAPVTLNDNTVIDIERVGSNDIDSLTLTYGIEAGNNSLRKIGFRTTLSTEYIFGGYLSIEQGTFRLIPDGGASLVRQLTIGTQGLFDLTNNAIDVNNGSLSDIDLQIIYGYGSGNWNGRNGITSSIAAVTPGTGLGVLAGTQYLAVTPGGQFDGIDVYDADVIIEYTWLGDINLDGIVNAADLALMAPGGTTNATWGDGDFNYNGKVNADDYALFMLGAAESDGRNIFTTLPEPNVLMLAAGYWLTASSRFRRRGPLKRPAW